MARLMLGGAMARVELVREEDQVRATCDEHSPFDGRLTPAGNCSWTEVYDTMDDAVEYAADHADQGTQAVPAAPPALFGSDAHGGPMSGEGPVNVIDGCDWPLIQCLGHEAPNTQTGARS